MGLRLPIFLTVLILAAAPARGAPASQLWERWVAQDPASALLARPRLLGQVPWRPTCWRSGGGEPGGRTAG